MIGVVGLSHKTAPIEVRERLALPRDVVPRLLEDLASAPGVGEVGGTEAGGRGSGEIAADVLELPLGLAPTRLGEPQHRLDVGATRGTSAMVVWPAPTFCAPARRRVRMLVSTSPCPLTR